MEKLEKYITDELTGLKYKLIGDYYFMPVIMSQKSKDKLAFRVNDGCGISGSKKITIYRIIAVW